MARKQAKRRKPARKRQLPTIRLSRLLGPLFAVALVFVSYELTLHLLERPVSSLEISGPMQRVSAVELEDAIADELERGFFSADLDRMRDRIQALQWVDQAAVARRWPDRIAIQFTEQVPAAVWGESGLMNVRGELFVEEGADYLPEDLPRLAGPGERASEVARRYLDVREALLPLGLDVGTVEVNNRGAWRMTLSNGVEVRLGKRDVDARTGLLVSVVADIIAARAREIDYVDLRYSSGFTIGWRQGSPAGDDPEKASREMLAAAGNG